MKKEDLIGFAIGFALVIPLIVKNIKKSNAEDDKLIKDTTEQLFAQIQEETKSKIMGVVDEREAKLNEDFIRIKEKIEREKMDPNNYLNRQRRWLQRVNMWADNENYKIT